MLKKTKWTKKCSKSSLASPGLAVLNHDVFLPVWMLFIAVKWDFLFCPPPLKKIPAARCWSVTCRFAGFSVNLIGWKEQMAKRSLLVYRKDRWQHENGMFRNPLTDGSKIGRNSFGTVYRQTLVTPSAAAALLSQKRRSPPETIMDVPVDGVLWTLLPYVAGHLVKEAELAAVLAAERCWPSWI